MQSDILDFNFIFTKSIQNGTKIIFFNFQNLKKIKQ
jgi:hypothetical protein